MVSHPRVCLQVLGPAAGAHCLESLGDRAPVRHSYREERMDAGAPVDSAGDGAAGPCGGQALTGRNHAVEPHTPGAILQLLRPIGGEEREEWTTHEPGAFDTLQAEGVAIISASGDRRHRVYTVSVRSSLPLLHPAQVADLRAETPDCPRSVDRGTWP